VGKYFLKSLHTQNIKQINYSIDLTNFKWFLNKEFTL